MFQRSKPDTSKHPSQSQSLSELQNIRRPSISGPFCPQKTCIMDTDKKPEEGQSVRHSERRHSTAPSGKSRNNRARQVAVENISQRRNFGLQRMTKQTKRKDSQ
ncbi:hypothetical protein P5673_029442, partial [Acropora cervicornis]